MWAPHWDASVSANSAQVWIMLLSASNNWQKHTRTRCNYGNVLASFSDIGLCQSAFHLATLDDRKEKSSGKVKKKMSSSSEKIGLVFELIPRLPLGYHAVFISSPRHFYSPQWLSEWEPGRSIWCFLHSAPSICADNDRSNDKWTGTHGLWCRRYFKSHRVRRWENGSYVSSPRGRS